MLSKSDSKFIKSLQLKKHRRVAEQFITEGSKNLLELIGSDYSVHKLFLTQQFYDVERYKLKTWYDQIEIVTEKELIQCGTFQSNQAGLAIVNINKQPPTGDLDNLTLVLNEVRDPGNLGTIIRIADWYGLKTIICSEGCADNYNPKVINSSMGSFFRIHCFYTNIEEYLIETDLPVIGATMDGQNVHNYDFPAKAILVIGNEASGIGVNLHSHLTAKLSIPGFGKAESLNAAVAAAIFCDNFVRNNSSTQVSYQ